MSSSICPERRYTAFKFLTFYERFSNISFINESLPQFSVLLVVGCNDRALGKHRVFLERIQI